MPNPMRKPPMGMGERPKVKKGTLKRLITYILKGNRLKIAAVLACVVISSLTTVAYGLFIERLIGEFIEPLLTQGEPDFAPLALEIAKMAGIFLVGIAASYLQSFIMAYVSQGVLRKIRNEMFAHLQRLPIKYFDTNTHGDIMSRFTNDTDTLRQLVSQTLIQVVSSFVTIAAVFAAMCYTSPHLTLLVVIYMSFMLFFSSRIAKRSGSHFIGQQTALGKVNGYVEEMITGQKVIKVFCHESAAKKEFDSLNEALFDSAYNANKYANILGPVNNNLGHLQYVLIAFVGGLLAVSSVGGLGVASVAAFMQLAKSFVNPINQVSQQMNTAIMALAGAQRIFELMDEEKEVDNGYVTLVNAEYKNGELCESERRTGKWAWRHPHEDGSVTYTELRGEVRFYDVDFSYDGEKTVLHDISLYAKPGQKVAFVGATGAGKTTITNLINRFYDLADGKVRYDGININKIKKDDLRRSLGFVLQDTNLFTGTVMENIRYGKLDATDEQVIEAARLANADDFIRRLPNGYDTMLTGNAAELSQGQKQLISIARAAVADPPVMVLDEATSSIDTRTEALVQKGMDSLMRGRTVFVIAHRLSTVQNSDVIMVLEHGRIIERGTHEQLIELGGQYSKLYSGAFELE